MKWHACSLLPALLIFATVAQGLLVIGPQKLRANRRYTMVMSNFLFPRVDILLTLTNGSNGAVYVTKTADVQRNRNQLVEFDVPDEIAAGSYTLTLNGQRGFSFYEEIVVEVVSKSFSGLIQFNKPVFRPGETVQFRVIVLDSDLKPPKNLRSVSVVIENGKGDNVRKWDAAELQIGVYEGSFQIAPSPALGTYKVIVASGHQELVSKTFEVKEYVLSRFEVDVFLSTPAIEEHQGLNLTISAKNVFGKPVSGKVHLTMFTNGSLSEVKATRQVDGVEQLEMRFNKPLDIYDQSEEVNLNFTFTEQYTNRSIAKSLQFTVYKTNYIAKLVKETPGFLPGKEFRATVKMEHRDGSPARSVSCKVEVDGLEDTYVKTFATDDKGEITLKFTPTENYDISVTVSVGENILLAEKIERDQQSEALFKITFRSGVQLSKPIKLQVTCRRKVKFLAYYVLSKGNVIDQGFKSLTGTRIQIELKYSDNMVPVAKVFVATVVDSTVLYATKDIVFQDLLNNFDMEIENKEVKPGEEIEVKMHGRPASYVALAAYDISLLQYGATHDLHWNDVQEVYENFHGINENEFDVFQSIGLFAKVSGGITLDIATSDVGPGGRAGKLSKLVPSRVNFAESFFWKNATLNQDRRLILGDYTPHTLSAWCLTGFSMHPMYGLGIVKAPLQFSTVKAFYIVDHLPYSIKQEEVAVLQFTIFNNLGTDYDTEVTLDNVQNQFEFVESSPNDKVQTKTLTVKQAVPAHVSFLVKAKKLGEMVIRVKASNSKEIDDIKTVIRVMPKSLVSTGIETRIFGSTNFTNQTFELSLNIDKNADAGSIKITFSVEPNLLSGVMENLNNLIPVPTGSGESNMIHFVPHVAVMDYLTAINPTHSKIEDTKKLLGQGFQNQLKYRLTDGSFKDFEQTNSSIFLTAFVAKSLQTAAKYIPDEVKYSMVNKSYEWLASKQDSSGRFEEVGPILLQHLQTKERKSIGLTSYVLIAFLENPNTKETFSSVIENGIKYISNHTNDIVDLFDLAIATYALSLHDLKSNSTETLRGKLISKGTMNTTTGEMYWPRETHSIETTAYALLALAEAKNLIHNGIMSMRWLVKQRHVTGSFPRTQDTFVGLQALVKLIEIVKPERNDYEIDLMVSKRNAKQPIRHSFIINPQDIAAKNFEDIPTDTKKVSFTVAGKGFGLISLKYEYSLNLRNYAQRFNLTLEKLKDSSNQLELKICARFLPKLADERSGKTLVEVNFPSGYVVDTDPISEVSGGTPVKTEIRFGATSVVLYYENMGTENNCFVVTAYRIFKVTMRRPAYVLVHDFYNPEYNALQTYYTAEDL